MGLELTTWYGVGLGIAYILVGLLVLLIVNEIEDLPRALSDSLILFVLVWLIWPLTAPLLAARGAWRARRKRLGRMAL